MAGPANLLSRKLVNLPANKVKMMTAPIILLSRKLVNLSPCQRLNL